MNAPSATPAHRRAFTLVELLVVIAIIVVLASVGFNMGRNTIIKSHRLADTNTATNLALGIGNYYGDYSRFPEIGAEKGSADTRTESTAPLMNVLLAFGPDGKAQNTRGIRYYSGRTVKGRDSATAFRGLFYSGSSSVELFDVWKKRAPLKRHYQVIMDSNHDGEIDDPVANGETVRGVSVLVWSTGRDGKDSGSSDQAEENRDNVYSWR